MLANHLGGAKRPPMRAAIAYVGKRSPVKPRRGDVLICDASKAAIKCGETDAQTLLRWHKAKAAVRSYPGLHAKVAICGSIAIIGSSNWSGHSESHLVEATLVSDRMSVRGEVEDFLADCVEGSELLGPDELAELCRLPVSPRRFIPGTSVDASSSAGQAESKFLFTWIGTGERYVPEEEVDQAVAEVRERTKRPRLRCTEYTFAAGDPLVAQLQERDWFAFVDHCSRKRVVEPLRVLDVRVIGRVRLVLVEERTWRTSSWKDFAAAAAALGLPLRSARPHRYLSPPHAQRFLAAIEAGTSPARSRK